MDKQNVRHGSEGIQDVINWILRWKNEINDCDITFKMHMEHISEVSNIENMDEAFWRNHNIFVRRLYCACCASLCDKLPNDFTVNVPGIGFISNKGQYVCNFVKYITTSTLGCVLYSR